MSSLSYSVFLDLLMSHEAKEAVKIPINDIPMIIIRTEITSP